MKIIGDRNKGALFPTLQGKTFSAKSSLTKSLKSLDAAVPAFNGLGDEERLLTKQRCARSLMEAVEKVDSKNQYLE